MFHKKTLKDIDIDGKRVLLRADFNVPLNGSGEITSDFRIEQTLPTIKALQAKNCKIIICSHLGRPKGKPDEKFSLYPVAKALSKLLKHEVTFVKDCVGENVRDAVAGMKGKDVVLLENLRFHPEEKKNDKEFAEKIAVDTGAQVFVQDGFGVVHRKHASTDSITHLMPAVSGLLLQREVDTITEVMSNPRRPLMAIVGGAKIADKIEMIDTFIKMADFVVIGGAMANTFLKAEGVEVGTSVVDDDELDVADDVMERVRTAMKKRNFVFYLPQDGVIATEIDKKAKTRIVGWDTDVIASIEAYPARPKAEALKLRKNEKILDIGPVSSAFITGAMQVCATVVWNGTMGVTEIPALHGPVGPFANGTEAVVDSLIGKYGNKPFSLLGGGDTAAYVEERDMADMLNHVSTGGGASLELMAGRELPGVAALLDKKG